MNEDRRSDMLYEEEEGTTNDIDILIIWLHSKFIKNIIMEEQPWINGQQQSQKV